MWIIIIFVLCTAKLFFDWLPPRKFPPGPWGLPLIHNILDLQKMVKTAGSHGVAWCHLAKQYGPIVGLRLGLADPLIIISGREAVMEMLKRSEFDGRPNGFVFTLRTLGEKRGVLFTDGKVWSEQRIFSLKNLKNFGWTGQIMEDMVLEDAESLIKIIRKSSECGIIRNLSEITSVAILNSLWSLLGGSRFDIEKCEKKLVEALRLLNDASKESKISGGLINHLPFLRHVAPKLSGYSRISERINRMWSFFAEEVSLHKLTKQDGVFRDLIDIYLEEIETKKNDPTSSFNEAQLIALLRDLFSAGVETTNNAIGFTIGYLAIHPEIQKKVHEELDTVIGKDNLPSVASRNLLSYFNATLTEVLRLANIGPTTIPHRATEDTELWGYRIKKNYTLLANLMSVHHDKEHWGDPEVFRPERFIDSNGQYISDPWLIPFGAGKRKCLGEVLAKNSHFLFTCCLLQKFEFSIPLEKSPPKMTGIDGFTLSPPQFDLVVTPR